jgi:heme/copper-type cytochrome/quinol oxidase subunit 2
MLPLIFWLPRLPAFIGCYGYMNISQVFHYADICYLVVVVLLMMIIVVVVTTMTMMMILKFQKKKEKEKTGGGGDFAGWQTTDLYQCIIHTGIQLFILHTGNPNSNLF